MAIKTPPEFRREAFFLDINRTRDYSYMVGVIVRFGWFYVDPEADDMDTAYLYHEAAEFLEDHLPEYIFGRDSEE